MLCRQYKCMEDGRNRSWRLGPFALSEHDRIYHRIDMPTWAYLIEKSFHNCMKPMTDRFMRTA